MYKGEDYNQLVATCTLPISSYMHSSSTLQPISSYMHSFNTACLVKIVEAMHWWYWYVYNVFPRSYWHIWLLCWPSLFPTINHSLPFFPISATLPHYPQVVMFLFPLCSPSMSSIRWTRLAMIKRWRDIWRWSKLLYLHPLSYLSWPIRLQRRTAAVLTQWLL